MKKIFITIGALAVIVVVFFGVRYGLRRGDFSDMSRPADSSIVATSTDLSESATSTRPKSEDDAFRVSAMKILDRPFLANADISDQLKQFASQKIKEASDMLRTNYDYANPWYDLGSYRKLIGDYVGADEAWSFVSRIRPGDSISLHNLGDLYYFLKNYPKAEQYFLSSINKNPQNVDAYVQLSAIYEYNDMAKTSLIEPLLLRGIAANPSEPNLMIALGQYYQNKGDIVSAKKYFEQALKLNPKNTELEKELQALGK